MVLLSTAYMPPVSWFAAIAEGMTLSPDKVIPSAVCLEAHEHYCKQSYRNRCHFYAENGVQYLNVPVKHGDIPVSSVPIREIEVDYSTPWLLRQERAIVSAYRSSAFFDYYKDELFGILGSMEPMLWDLNMHLIRFFLDNIGIAADISLTEEYVRPADIQMKFPGVTDLREVIHPKKPDTILGTLGLEKPYFQVFASRSGFKSNLSVMDLLFNEGPDSVSYLVRSIS